MSNTAPSRADPVVVFPFGRWCPPQETSQPHPPHPKGPIYNIPALVQIMVWHRPGNKPLSEPMMISLMTHICVTRPQWFKNIAILVWVMAWCWKATNHYLNQWWTRLPMHICITKPQQHVDTIISIRLKYQYTCIVDKSNWSTLDPLQNQNTIYHFKGCLQAQ